MLHKMAQVSHLKVIVQFILFSDLYLKAFTNCTANCVNTRREWPKFDFEFYYDSSNAGHSINPTQVEYSLQSESSVHSSILENSTPSRPSLTNPPALSPSFSPAIVSSNILTTQPNNLKTLSVTSPSQIDTSNSLSNDISTPISAAPTQNHPNETYHNWSNGSAQNCFDNVLKYQSNLTSLIQTNKSDQFLENYLLRTVFNSSDYKGDNQTDNNLKHFFGDILTRIYEYGLDKQKQQFKASYHSRKLLSTNKTAVNLTIWDFQIDNSSQTIDVIYYVRKDGILVPYEDASKILSFVSKDIIRNLTGYDAIHKVQIYNVEAMSSKLVYSWISYPYLLLILLILIICIIIILLIYIKYRKEKQKWLDAINRELNRVIPSTSSQGGSHHDNDAPWNYESEQDDNYDNDAHPNNIESREHQIHKIDQESQCDQPSDYTIRPLPITPNSTPTQSQHKNERLIPISHILRKNPDYDRISYIKTQETIQETQKHPNILEIKLSHETQSIVKEIRKELNRYNFKKIIPDGNDTSDA